jgi:hypothetical protein
VAQEKPPLPKRIKMGPYTFKVTTDPAVLDAVAGSSGHVAGFSTLTAELIGIGDSNLHSHAYKADTLLHELVHMAFSVNGFGFESTEAEEKVVLALTTNLLHMLRENPAVVTYLTHKD